MYRFKKNRSTIIMLLFILPALLTYIISVLVPVIGGLWYSLTDWNGLNPTYKMVGLSNYIEALTDDRYFLDSILFTLKYVGYMVVLQNGIALLLAVLVESRNRSKEWFRTIFFMPNMISMIIGGFIWMFIFTKVLPYIAEFTVFKFLDQSWIGNPRFSFYAILTVSLWSGVGYLMLIYISALQGVPKILRESARIDGAGPFHVFRYITIPMILPAITVGIFLSLNSSFKVFDVVYAMTGGGPGRSTQVIALNIYEEAFSMFNRYGYASAKAVILFLIVAVITVIQLRLMKNKEVEL